MIDQGRRDALKLAAATVMGALAVVAAPKVVEAGGNKHQNLDGRVTALETAVAEHEHYRWPRPTIGMVRQAAAKWETLAALLETDADENAIAGGIGDALDAMFEALDRIDEGLH